MDNLIFSTLEVSEELHKAIADMGFEEATPVQSQSIRPILEGRDVVAQAPTGTGKTCAFGIPLIEKIEPSSRSIDGLILCPTRELVIQTTDELLKLSKYKQSVRIVPVYGGQQIDRQIFALKKQPQIIVATPGRLMDHMRRHTIKIDTLRYLVLDEADEMLNMGFREDIDTILQTAPAERQTVLFSATLSKDILDITGKYQHDQLMIKVTHKELTVPTVEQLYLEVKHSMKIDVLTRLIDANSFKLSMVFCNTKKMVDELTESLAARGYLAEGIHGDLKQQQRDKVMAKFRSGTVDILVATDVAARGIDVDDIEAVFNYDIPSDEEYYVHRIGRTGRANRKGVSYTFVTAREMYKLRDIMRYTKSPMKLIKAPTLSEIEDVRQSRALLEIRSIIENNKHKCYLGAVEKLLDEDESNEITSLDIAAALLYKAYGEPVSADPKRVVVKEFAEAAEKPRKSAGYAPDGDTARLFINVGSLDKIRQKHILELFKMLTDIRPSDIGDIDIFDKYSFVTIPSAEAEYAIEALGGAEYKNRRLAVEIANAKKDGGRRPAKGGRGGYNRPKKGGSGGRYKKDR